VNTRDDRATAPADLVPMRRMRVGLADRAYDIVIADGLLENPDAMVPAVLARGTAVVVSNPTVSRLHGASLDAWLTRHDACDQVLHVDIPEGEEHKTWASVDAIVSAMLREGCDRRSVLYALGGGVVGDITGFAAACYMRGVRCVQVPTTLLAQVDSSVGGKTAINHPLGKNMVGAFHQPSLVLCDLATLATLPERDYRSGLAEVLKYGPIADASLLDWIEAHVDDLHARHPDALLHAVERSCAIKADVVARDERENDVRAILNFGHTFGHAIEGALGWGTWLHGEAVACGMVMASALSVEIGAMPDAFEARMRRVVDRLGLPSMAPALPWPTWSQWMRVDKKALDGAIRYVVIESIGNAGLRAVPDDVVVRVVERCAAIGSVPAAMSSSMPRSAATSAVTGARTV
jgi:3-dehydroquinate synthase